MKITGDIQDKDRKDIMRFTGENKKEPTVAKFVATGFMLERRRKFSEEMMSGKSRIEFFRMMWPRLQLLKELFAKNGAIIVSINDYETHRLCAR